jgi:hypothetical protein
VDSAPQRHPGKSLTLQLALLTDVGLLQVILLDGPVQVNVGESSPFPLPACRLNRLQGKTMPSEGSPDPRSQEDCQLYFCTAQPGGRVPSAYLAMRYYCHVSVQSWLRHRHHRCCRHYRLLHRRHCCLHRRHYRRFLDNFSLSDQNLCSCSSAGPALPTGQVEIDENYQLTTLEQLWNRGCLGIGREMEVPAACWSCPHEVVGVVGF